MPTAVSGDLVDAETGQPLTEVETFLQQEGAETRVVLTNERGEFAFKDLARTSYTITTHAPATTMRRASSRLPSAKSA